MSGSQLGKNTAYLYIETLVSLVSGYAFWVIVSRMTTPDVVGTSSAVIAFATIFATIAAIGIPSGIQRFLGKSYSEKSHHVTKAYIRAAVVLLSLGTAAAGLSILALQVLAPSVFPVGLNLVLISVIYVAAFSFTSVFRAAIISSLKTWTLPAVMIGSTAAKIGLTVVLVLTGMGAVGVTIGFTSFSIISALSFVIVLLPILRSRSEDKSKTSASNYSKELLTASAASWIPSLIYTIGAHLGTLTVFGSQGAEEAGVYFMAFSIVIAVSALMQVLFTIAFPLLSAMKDSRKRFIWQMTKLSLVMTIPLSSALMFYSQDIMLLFGKQYALGSESLQILLLSMIPTALATGVSTLAYAYGNYRQVLAIGLASNLPRAVLYFALPPFYGSNAAAMAYTLGSFAGLAIALVLARRLGMKHSWTDVVSIGVIPSIAAYGLSFFHVNYIVGILSTLAISYFLLIVVRVVRHDDIGYLLNLLPNRVAKPIFALMGPRGETKKQV